MTSHHEQRAATDTDLLELEIQRLIDGELAADGRRTLLQQADDRPAIWRRIAVRFIEEQSLQANRYVFADCAPPSGDSGGPSRGDRSNQSQAIRPHRPPVWGLLAGLAACLLLGVSIGRFTTPTSLSVSETARPMPADPLPDAVERSPLAEPSPAAEPVPITNPVVPRAVAADTTTRLVGLNKTGQSVVELPIVPVKSLSSDVLMGHDHASLDDLHRELARRGIELRYQTTVVDGKLPNGRQMYLPVHEMTLTNVGY